jgi:hypothetical protein
MAAQSRRVGFGWFFFLSKSYLVSSYLIDSRIGCDETILPSEGIIEEIGG